MAGKINNIEFIAQGHVDSPRTMYVQGEATAFGVTHKFSCHMYLWPISCQWFIGEVGKDEFARKRSFHVANRWRGKEYIASSPAFDKVIMPMVEKAGRVWAMLHEADFVQAEGEAYDSAITETQAKIKAILKEAVDLSGKLHTLTGGK